MDPNVTLKEMREAIDHVARDVDKGYMEHEGVDALLGCIGSLDAWLKNGGALPAEWRGGVVDILHKIIRVFMSQASVQRSEGRSQEAHTCSQKAEAIKYACEVLQGHKPVPEFRL